MLNIGISLNFNDSYDRGVTSGILSFARDNDWRMFSNGLWFSSFSGVKLDGMIARIESEQDVSRCRKYGIPVVDIAGAISSHGFDVVKNDDRLTGSFIGRHLMQSNTGRFAIVSVKGTSWSAEREEGFIDSIRLDRRSVPVFCAPLAYWHDTYGNADDLDRFLSSLPHPTALFCCNDLSAMKTMIACERLRIKVPKQLAIAGVDDEQLMCMLVKPSLTSLKLRLEKIGYEAASRLQDVIEGKRLQPAVKLVPPSSIVERESTFCFFSHDRIVAQTMMNIKRLATSGLSCGEIIADIPLSRRRIEERFFEERGRTLLEEVIACRLSHAKELLESGDSKVETIWRSCGFGSAQRFYSLFGRHFQMTPDAWRKVHRQ
ncbi:MAG: substrate-binding domain-containing protein [Sphaerochaetaceae bacterium]|jgi:LacI family transcriptional regulator|nr:substrate-binding domain-containing protein [Sphaerochaetaceae bacterium]NLY07740.1 substrate-binding domain-containing protein [Spirochaetales bacterium]